MNPRRKNVYSFCDPWQNNSKILTTITRAATAAFPVSKKNLFQLYLPNHCTMMCT